MSFPSNPINDSGDLGADSFIVSARVLIQSKKMTMTLTSAGWLRVVGIELLFFFVVIDAILATIW